jgi:hypothetical protein
MWYGEPHDQRSIPMEKQFDVSHVRQTPGLLSQVVGVETLLYDEATHRAFCLNAMAAQVWQQLDCGRSVAQIAAAVSAASCAPVTEEMILLAISELRRDGLVRGELVPCGMAVPSRRELLHKLGAGAVMMLPAVAIIMAPKAAQATSIIGCVDCDAEPGGTINSSASSNPTRMQQEQQSAQQPDSVQTRKSDSQELFVP